MLVFIWTNYVTSQCGILPYKTRVILDQSTSVACSEEAEEEEEEEQEEVGERHALSHHAISYLVALVLPRNIIHTTRQQQKPSKQVLHRLIW